jgi:transketolase
MLNQDLHLHPNTLDRDALEHLATRDGFGRAIIEAAEADERVVALCADVTESVRLDGFKEKFPTRYVEMGVAEQNMATVASGLANYGKIPFMATYAVFSPGRNWEQVRTTIALADLPVKIMGMHGGVSVGEDGATHQALEDITLMRVLPNMVILVPCDAEEARKTVLASVHNHKPTYIRFSRHKTPVFTTPETPYAIGRAEYLWRSNEPKVALMGAGPILYDALQAAKILESEGIGSSVLNLHSVKPMDIDKVKEAARDAGAVVSVEEHQILGGIGSTIAEILSQNTPTPLEMVAVHDRFGQSGTPEELLHEYRLDTGAILDAARRVIARKS